MSGRPFSLAFEKAEAGNYCNQATSRRGIRTNGVYNHRCVCPASQGSDQASRIMERLIFDSRLRTILMHLMQNAETIDRLVIQGGILLKSFHAEYKKDPIGRKTEFLCGNLAGWRDTLHTLYHGCAEEIVDRVVVKTCLSIPDTLVHSFAPRDFREQECKIDLLT